MNYIELLLQHLSEFVSFKRDDEKLIETLFEERIYRSSDFFLREGEVCKALGFVVKGIFRYYIDHDGEDRTYNFATERHFVCNYESLIRQSPSPKHIQAIEDSVVLTISYDNLQRFYSEVKEGNHFGRIHMEKIYADMVRQLVAQYTETPEQRYLNFLKNYPELNQRLPQYYIASYVGVKPQSLSRIRKRLTSKSDLLT
jgi:CRP-like cAMP-binding protein